MLFKTQELKKLLLSVTKYKVDNIQIKSTNLRLNINTKRNQKKFFIEEIKPCEDLNQKIENKKTFKPTIEKHTSNINKERKHYFTIVSPMIGTFYRAPAPNEAPFIEINDKVKINETVCIIEAMKLMNEIESEVNGHIVEILVKDGDIVDCGQALIRIKKEE